MGYLLIKKDDVKTFKSFLSGNEIEGGVKIGENANIFHPNDEGFVFYGNDDSDTYRARVTRQKRISKNPNDPAVLALGLVKDGFRSQS